MLKAYLVTNHYLNGEKFLELNRLLCDSAERNDIQLIVKTNASLLREIILGGKENVEKVDFVLFWDKDITLCRMLEEMGMRVFNSSFAIAACDNKGMTHALLQNKIKMPKTVVAPLAFSKADMTSFVKSVGESLGYPFIIKESCSSFGFGVYKVDDFYSAVEIANNISPNQMIFQEYIASSRGRDIRLNVVGDKVVAAMERYNDKDFRANITNGGKMKKYTPTKEECAMAVEACRLLGVDFGGVDILFGENGPLLCEVNSNAHIKNILDCTNINVADAIFSYIKGKLL